MNYKKIIVLSLISLLALISPSVYAWETSSWYKAVIEKDFQFKADLEYNWSVELEWKDIDTTWDFKYFKLVRSNNNPNPKYPEDWYIKYSADEDFTSYTDNKPKSWVNYYRICKIMKDWNRYCSKTQKIYIENKDATDKYNDKKYETDWYKTPVITDEFWLEVIQKEKEVVLEWKKLKEYDNNFKWLKIIRSNNNANPFYPNEWAIWVYTNENETRYVDYKPKTWVNYYRICLITDDNDRYCSKVKKAYYKNGNTNNSNYTKTNNTSNTNNYWITWKEKAVLNKMINSFFKKLESTNYSNDKKIDILENIINKLDELIDKNQKIKQQIEYLIILLKRKIETFQNSSWLDEIQKIFNEWM